MTTVAGIDISNRQGEIDWLGADLEDVAFAWVKATEGYTFNDAFLVANIAGARHRGLKVGGYHFAQMTRTNADLQAQHFRAYCGALDLPAMLDAEGPWLATRQASTDWVLRWLDSIGEPVRVLYTNGNGATVHLDSNRLVREGVELFYAHPDANGPDDFRGVGAWPTCAVLQHGGRELAGLGLVDSDSMLDTTMARFTGAPLPGDDDMPAYHFVSSDGQHVAVPRNGARPWLVALALVGPLEFALVLETTQRPMDPTYQTQLLAAASPAPPAGVDVAAIAKAVVDLEHQRLES